MSIAGVSTAEPPWWVWAIWLVAAVVMALVFGLRSKRADAAAPSERAKRAEDRAERRLVPLLAVAAMVSFCVWIGTQLAYVSVRRAAVATTTQPSPDLPPLHAWPAEDLAQLALFAGLAGWAAAFGLLLYGRGIKDIGYGLRRIPNGLLAGAIGVFIALPLVYYVLQLTEWLLQKFKIEHPQQHELLTVIKNDPTDWVRTMAVLSAVVAAPLFEEILFRGCVQGGLRRATRSPAAGILIASTLFVSLHAAWTIPPLFVFSVLLGITYERTRNLWATTVMHALFNTFSIVVSGMN